MLSSKAYISLWAIFNNSYVSRFPKVNYKIEPIELKFEDDSGFKRLKIDNHEIKTWI